MLITEKKLKIYRQHMSNDFLSCFGSIDQKGRKAFEKNVVFCCASGVDENHGFSMEALIRTIQNMMDNNEIKSKVYYGEIPIEYDKNNVQRIKTMYKEFRDVLTGKEPNIKELLGLPLFHGYENANFRLTLLDTLVSTLSKLSRNYETSADSQVQNLFFKLVYWLESEMPIHYGNKELKIKTRDSMKLLFVGIPNKHEWMYLDILNNIGIDILVWNPERKGKDQWPGIEFVNPTFEWHSKSIDVEMTELKKRIEASKTIECIETIEVIETIEKIQTEEESDHVLRHARVHENEKKEKSYEELAQLCESVVLIQVYDSHNEIIGRGSGVVVNEKGLIVTNVHVVLKGFRYGIRFENAKEEFFTEKILFMDVLNDLAFLKINKASKPLLLKAKDDLKRGQEIVTIGSPLGLMNTISNGIVSGFRNLDGVKFIQITAPISHGSSGGALLDKYGDLVGVTSAGFSEGQNLNLAVPVMEISRIINQDWLEIGELLLHDIKQFSIRGIQFIPRLSQDDNKDVVVLLYPNQQSMNVYRQAYIKHGSKRFDSGVEEVLKTILLKYKIEKFDYYFLPIKKREGQ